jgi:hypothetical protein
MNVGFLDPLPISWTLSSTTQTHVQSCQRFPTSFYCFLGTSLGSPSLSGFPTSLLISLWFVGLLLSYVVFDLVALLSNFCDSGLVGWLVSLLALPVASSSVDNCCLLVMVLVGPVDGWFSLVARLCYYGLFPHLVVASNLFPLLV